MCIFAGPVQSVTNTNLFARLTGEGTQLLAYQMNYVTANENAMILPIPVATPSREDSLRFISLKGYDQFFRHLDSAFPVPRPLIRNRVDSPSRASNSIPKLKVEEVGDFVASFVPTMDDFSRLDQRFVIPKSSWDKIPRYSDYGFAVFQLKSLRGKPHPMAFEFETRLEDEVFFPTVHIHDGEVHEREEFDHTLYLQNEEFDKVVGDFQNHRTKDRQTGFVRSQDVAKKRVNIDKSVGMIEPDLLLHRVKIRGKLENKDVFASVRPQASGGPRFGTLLPLTTVIGGSGLGWLIERRNRLRNSNAAASGTPTDA